MKPQRFEIGQAVGLIKTTGFTKIEDIPEPKDQIMHVHEYRWRLNTWYVKTDEYRYLIREDLLVPIITTSELTEALEEIEATIQL